MTTPKTATTWNDLADRVRRQEGLPLPGAQKTFYERGFGCSLDSIRIHVDEPAAAAVSADAFAIGRHIVLRQPPGDWNAPKTQRLIAHEIAHCLQQIDVGDAEPALAIGREDDPLELEAEQAAADLLAGFPVAPLSHAPQAVIRRAIRVKPDTATLSIDGATQELAPELRLAKSSGASLADQVWLQASFTIKGAVTLAGDAGDNFGVTVGLTQVLRESSTAIYRGENSQAGSMILTRGPLPGCRDTRRAGNVLIEDSGARDRGPDQRLTRSQERRFSVKLEDLPEAIYVCDLLNRRTGAINYLAEVDVLFHFVAVLTVQHSADHFEHLMHMAIPFQWRRSFDIQDIKNRKSQPSSTVEKGQSFTPRPSRKGAPTNNPHFGNSLLTRANAPNCLIEATKVASELQLAIDIVGRLPADDSQATRAITAGRNAVTKHLVDKGRLKINR